MPVVFPGVHGMLQELISRLSVQTPYSKVAFWSETHIHASPLRELMQVLTQRSTAHGPMSCANPHLYGVLLPMALKITSNSST